MSAFGGIIALFFGAIFFLPHLDDMPGPAKLFFAVWFLVVIGGIIYSLINAAGGTVPPGKVVEFEIDEGEKPPGTAKERLAELQELKQSGLISEEEFQSKRGEILRHL